MKMFARKNQVVGGIGKFMINRSLYERQTAFNIIYIMRTNMNPWEIYTLSVVIALVIEPTERYLTDAVHHFPFSGGVAGALYQFSFGTITLFSGCNTKFGDMICTLNSLKTS